MSPLKQMPLIAFMAMTIFSMKAHAVAPVYLGTSVKTVSTVSTAATPTPHAKSYREWKHEMVSEAQAKVANLKNQIDSRKQAKAGLGVDPNLAHTKGTEAVASKDLGIEKLERELREEQYDLDVANDLTVTDYFVGYLTKIQNKKAAFKEVAGKLSPEEVAELMTAYANSVFGAQSADLPTSAANVAKDPVK